MFLCCMSSVFCLVDFLHYLSLFIFIFFCFFFFNDTATTEIYTLSLHDALPILRPISAFCFSTRSSPAFPCTSRLKRSEEHTSELQSRVDLVCRLLLEKKKNKTCKRRRSSPRSSTNPSSR